MLAGCREVLQGHDTGHLPRPVLPAKQPIEDQRGGWFSAVARTGASGNTIGNGTGDVYYSKRAIALASTSYLDTGIKGSKNSVLAWWE